MPITWQPIGAGLAVPTDEHCRFTEDAVDLARFAAPSTDDTVCDLGSGSGVIPLLFCRRQPPAHIAAVEREPSFAALITQAVDRFALHARLAVYPVDWADDNAMPPAHRYSLVTCNPPYFKFGAARPCADPLVQAARHEDHPDLLLTLCRAAERLLTDNGRFCLCHRPERLEDIRRALHTNGLVLRRVQFVCDTPHAPPALVLIEAARHGEEQVLPARIRHPQATHTAVYKRLYNR